MRKLLAAVLVAVFALSGATVVKAGPGPNGSNDHGLCTAYFNGQKNGHDKQREDGAYPGPFAGLEEAGNEYTDNDGVDNDRDGNTDETNEHEDLTPAENIFNFCNDTSTIGGNPEHGRYTCTDDGSGDSDPNCEDNPAPGNS